MKYPDYPNFKAFFFIPNGHRLRYYLQNLGILTQDLVSNGRGNNNILFNKDSRNKCYLFN